MGDAGQSVVSQCQPRGSDHNTRRPVGSLLGTPQDTIRQVPSKPEGRGQPILGIRLTCRILHHSTCYTESPGQTGKTAVTVPWGQLLKGPAGSAA
ncbi:hypothetical protein GN956_G13417 [Arapaima gigas]